MMESDNDADMSSMKILFFFCLLLFSYSDVAQAPATSGEFNMEFGQEASFGSDFEDFDTDADDTRPELSYNVLPGNNSAWKNLQNNFPAIFNDVSSPPPKAV